MRERIPAIHGTASVFRIHIGTTIGHCREVMIPTNELVELQETLYASRNPTRRWLHCTRRDWIIAALKRRAYENRGRALEVGPGSGIYLPVLADLYDQVVGIDVETAYLEHAGRLSQRCPNLSLVADDITSSRLEPKSFDLILCTEVIEHIANSRAALQGMHRLLRKGGTLVLSTPQRYSPLELTARVAFLPGVIDLVRVIYREPILETGHINLMTERELTDQLSAAGFAVTERHKSGMYLPLVAEFLGNFGLRCEQWLERACLGNAFDKFLWTQYYIATV